MKVDQVCITGDFVKELKQGARETEVISGQFYYAPDGVLLFYILEPIQQVFTYNKDTLILFYPNQNLGFKIKIFNPVFTLPSNTPFIQKEKLNLAQLGFMFVKREKKADTLYSYWVPKEKNQIEKIILTDVSNKLTTIEIKTKRNHTIKVRYDKFIEYNNFNIPTDIYYIQFYEADTVIEHYQYKNLKFDVHIPDSILHFSIPEGAQIKEVMW